MFGSPTYPNGIAMKKTAVSIFGTCVASVSSSGNCERPSRPGLPAVTALQTMVDNDTRKPVGPCTPCGAARITPEFGQHRVRLVRPCQVVIGRRLPACRAVE